MIRTIGFSVADNVDDWASFACSSPRYTEGGKLVKAIPAPEDVFEKAERTKMGGE